MHIYGIQKNGNEFIYRVAVEKQTQRIDFWTWGSGEGEMYGKNNMETYIPRYKIDGQQEFAVWLRKLKQGLCISREGWFGAGDGRDVLKGGDICIPMADSC